MGISGAVEETSFLTTEGGGRLAYEVAGAGPLVVLAHGMGDNRTAYRETAARLVAAGYRVAALDLRGHGESDAGWASYTRADTADDLLALIRHLGGPAVLVGHSFAGGAATIAAAREPGLVDAVVEIAPFTRTQKPDPGAFLTDARYRKGMSLLAGAALLRSPALWRRYLVHAHPGTRPAGFAARLAARLAALDADLRRPGRMAVFSRFGSASPGEADARLADVRCPVLVIMGTLDPDWPDPRAEGEGIVAALPAGLGRLELVEGAGHYPHAQFPGAVAALVLDFLAGGRRG
ncbi:hydrolase [Streptomyces daghestanicus]|uniref:Hydrolase n=1 Tax=Streptomyces daghestanicus TaxID=66885 RepID=A0ABQ3Q4Y7_9ACTN|nr:hydrolase [Streptomyces daghestanicus]GHI32290.1 hydrolase [Streptomyces daghestanicus]